MKKKIFLLLILLIGVISCEKNEVTNEQELGKASLYGREVELSGATIWENDPSIVTSKEEYIHTSFGKEVKGYKSGDKTLELGNFSLSLYEKGLSLSDKLKKLIGVGMNISFHLSSPEKDNLKEGTYTFSDIPQEFTFKGYVVSVYRHDPDYSKDTKPATLKEGKIHVKKISKDEFQIDFDCKTTFGAELKGSYKGVVSSIPVRQESLLLEYKDIKLDALLDGIMLSAVYNGRNFDLGLKKDTGYDKAFFYTKFNRSVSADEAVGARNDVDIAFGYDKNEDLVAFKAPILMKDYLEDKEKYSFQCYTKYMKAPSSFTEENFKNLKGEDLNFKVQDEKVTFDENNFSPQFVFFETGKGVRGVIHVKSIIPSGKGELVMNSILTYYWEKKASIIVDIKCYNVPVIPIIR